MTISIDAHDFSLNLLDWYHRENYDFPWRNTQDPYSIWLSEVMLQQTRVSTVLPYYHHWLSVLPNIKSVSNTDVDIILKLWEGLGYYGRARNFYRACQIIIEKHNGKIPRDPIEFLKLPGVGPYICAAVMSIAFNMPIASIDGNAVRVVSRINTIKTPYPRSKKRIFTLLSYLIDPARPGEFNQAIMDLGREICTSKNPSCSLCPVSRQCRAYVNNSVDKYPVLKPSPPRPHYHTAIGVVWKYNRVLVSKRHESGLLGGLWEFPGGMIRSGERGPDCVIREAKEILNILVSTGGRIWQIKHAYSHFSITMDVYLCQIIGGNPCALGCADFRWIYPHETEKFAFHGASQKILDKIVEPVAV